MSTISREAAIAYSISGMTREIDGDKWIRVSEVRESIKTMPSAQPEIVRCKDCKWWDKKYESETYGYCQAIKHSYYSRHWEISIYRTYEADFFCADAEPKEEEDDPD